MYLNGHFSDREWLFLLYSYLQLVNCMDQKCHKIVYMKSWPNMNSKLWRCTVLTDFYSVLSYYHSPVIVLVLYSCLPLKLTKRAWPCANLLVVQPQILACCLMSPLIISKLLFLLSPQGGYAMAYCQKEISWWTAHTIGLVFWGICSPDCRSTASSIVGSQATWVKIPRAWAHCCRQLSSGCPWQWRHGKRTSSASCTVSHVTK